VRVKSILARCANRGAPFRYNVNAMNRYAIERVERVVSAALAGLTAIPGDRILIALSGGADSVALTHALHRLREGRRDRPGYSVAAAHLNHRLRGDESDRDERFVRDLCERLQIELVVERVEAAHSLIDSSNLEERARELRYAFLNRTADRVRARHIALAHHADDQAETVMLRLLRGSGVAGLAGMHSVGPGRIVRPLLTLRRGEILAYLEAIGASYVSDSSNLWPAILRNRVRHELLPMIERDYAPRLIRRLAGLARELHALDDYISGEGRRELNRRLQARDRLDLAGFGDLPLALSASTVREWLREYRGDLRGVYRAEIDRVSRFCADAVPGSTIRLARGWRVRCEYGCALIEPAPTLVTPPFAFHLAYDGVTEAGACGFTFVARMLSPGAAGFHYGVSDARPMEALFDAGEIEGGLIVRSFRPGDRIRPLGMTGTRKIHDVFVDRKLPRERRATWPIVESRNEIMWIPGMVRSRFALLTEATDKLLQLKAKQSVSVSDPSLLGN
jgi:tRNA(Ile)-lysidine synthase